MPSNVNGTRLADKRLGGTVQHSGRPHIVPRLQCSLDSVSNKGKNRGMRALWTARRAGVAMGVHILLSAPKRTQTRRLEGQRGQRCAGGDRYLVNVSMG